MQQPRFGRSSISFIKSFIEVWIEHLRYKIISVIHPKHWKHIMNSIDYPGSSGVATLGKEGGVVMDISLGLH